MQQLHFDVAIIGGGILGCSIAYFLASFSNASVIVIEQENNFGMHASRRNTGKVHAPFLYDPAKRTFTAKVALKGFDMLKKYCKASAEVVYVRGTGHYPMIEKPAEFNAALEKVFALIGKK